MSVHLPTSITEIVVLNPIKYGLASNNSGDCSDFFCAEVARRLLAVTLPVFAFIESAICLVGAIGFGIFSYNGTADELFERFLVLLVMGVAGPIIGIINPNFLENLWTGFLSDLKSDAWLHWTLCDMCYQPWTSPSNRPYSIVGNFPCITEIVVLDPIKDDLASNNSGDCSDFFCAEVARRLLAVTLPVFAFIEAGVCLLLGCGFGTTATIALWCCHNRSGFPITEELFKRFRALLVMGVVGSTLGIINPNLLDKFWTGLLPPPPSSNNGAAPPGQPPLSNFGPSSVQIGTASTLSTGAGLAASAGAAGQQSLLQPVV